MIRIVFLLLLLMGAGLAFVYPQAALRNQQREIQSWRVHYRGGLFTSVETALAPADAPVSLVFEVAAIVPDPMPDASVLTVTVATGTTTVVAKAMGLAAATVRDDSPQTPFKLYRLDAATLPQVSAGSYTFTTGPGDAEGVELVSVDLKLLAGPAAPDQRAVPVGLSLVAVGFIGLVLSFRRPRPVNPNAQPPPRWGRGGRG